MKIKSILLSSIILGGFISPVLSTTTVMAETSQTKTEQSTTKETSPTSNNQISREKKVNLGVGFDLNSLDNKTSIVIPAKTQDGKHVLDDIFINLTDTEIETLKSTKKVDFTIPQLETTSDWGGKLGYASTDKTMSLNFNENTQALSLSNGEYIPYKLISGDSRVHYVQKDTGKEIHVQDHPDAYTTDGYESDLFEVLTLTELDLEDKIIGYFDTTDIDFEHLADLEPLNPTTPDYDSPIRMEFDRNSIGKDNTEYTVYLEKAKPQTVILNVYLDGTLFSTESFYGEINSNLAKKADPELPNEKTATLDKNLTSFSTTNEYFPQYGTSSISGKYFHNRIFENDDDDEKLGLLNASIQFASDDEHFGNRIELNKAGKKSTVEIHYKSNHLPDDKVIADLSIKSNIGIQIVPNITGKKGQTITVKVPVIKGYTSDKTTVTATFDNEGNIETTEEVFYTKVTTDENENDNNPGETPTNPDENGNGGLPSTPGGNNNGSETVKPPVITPMPQPEDFNGFIGTMKKDVTLFSLNKDKMSPITNKQLSKHSDWKSDQVIKIDGVKYYRVATNEWVKSSDVYRYENQQGIVDTKNVQVTYLVSSDKDTFSNRGLAAKTSWKYDRIGYLGDKEEKYYRVATNEFVHESDVNTK